MHPYDASTLMRLVDQLVPDGGPLFAVRTIFEIHNNHLGRMLLEGDADLHGQPEADVEGFRAYIWCDDGVVSFSFFNKHEVDARTKESMALIRSIEGGTPIDDATLVAKVTPSPTRVVVACVRLHMKDGRHSIALYHNTALSTDEALGFAKRKAEEYAAENTAPSSFS